MKNIIFIVLMSMPIMAYAQESCVTTTTESVEGKMEIDTKVPKNLEGAIITIRTEDGQEKTMPAEQFKVVPRKQQFIVNKTRQIDRINCPPSKNVRRPNRLSLLVGQGYKYGIEIQADGNTLEASSRVGIIGGIQYQRLVTDRVSVGGQVLGSDLYLKNKQLLIMAGWEW